MVPDFQIPIEQRGVEWPPAEPDSRHVVGLAVHNNLQLRRVRRNERSLIAHPIPAIHARRVRLLRIHQEKLEDIRREYVKRVISRLRNFEIQMARIRGKC